MDSLATVLERGVRRMWPRRAQRELLLDLGEREGWGPTARSGVEVGFAGAEEALDRTPVDGGLA